MPRTNPRRKPASQADVERARLEGQAEGARYMAGALFMALTDTVAASDDDFQTIWNRAMKIHQEVIERRITWADIMRTLKEERGFRINID